MANGASDEGAPGLCGLSIQLHIAVIPNTGPVKLASVQPASGQPDANPIIFVFIQDSQNMAMTIGVVGDQPSALELALLTCGHIPIKPQSVDVDYYIVTTGDDPLFGGDAKKSICRRLR